MPHGRARRAVLAAAVALAARPCSADNKVRHVEYATGATARYGEAEPLVSRDGYHYAVVMAGEGGVEVLHKDGRELGRASPGTYTTIPASSFDRTPRLIGDIADNGVLFHSMRFVDPDGRAGRRLALDARPHGALFDAIEDVRASPAGDNVAYVTRDGTRYAVSTLSGRSPASETPPQILGVSSSQLFFRFNWNGRDWIYRDSAALPHKAYMYAAAHPRRPVVAGTLFDEGGVTLEVDGKKAGGPWADAVPYYSDGGALVVFARTSRALESGLYDAVVVEGAVKPVAPFKPAFGLEPTVQPGSGTPFYVADVADKPVIFAGGRSYAGMGQVLSARGWVGFSPSGRRWAAVVIGKDRIQIAVDGEASGAFVPPPLREARILFDSEAELHYLGQSVNDVVLVCVTLDGRDPRSSRCAREAAGKGYKVSSLDAESPGLMRGIVEPPKRPTFQATPQ